MIPKIFSSEQFVTLLNYNQALYIEKTAQSIFEAWLKSENSMKKWIESSGEMIYSDEKGPWHNIKQKSDTHQALLVSVEPIKNDACEHIVIMRDLSKDPYFKCCECSKELNFDIIEVE